jgi:hypothetical protein
MAQPFFDRQLSLPVVGFFFFSKDHMLLAMFEVATFISWIVLI